MAVKRFSTSFISDSGQDKSSNFIANYSPAIDEMELIERVRVGSGGTSAIEFTNIPATYQHLQIRGVARRTTGTNSNNFIQFNSITTANYAQHRIQGNGSAASASGNSSTTYIFIFDSHANYPSVSNQFGSVVIDILDYSSTSKNKTVRSIGGNDMNGAGIISLSSGLWVSTSSISSIKVFTFDTWAEYTTFSLYGVKA